MARTRAQARAELSARQNRTSGIQGTRRPPPQTTRVRETRKQTFNRHRARPSSKKSRLTFPYSPPEPTPREESLTSPQQTPGARTPLRTAIRKRSHDDQDTFEDRRSVKRQRLPCSGESGQDKGDDGLDPVAHWASEGRWPRQYFELQADMQHFLARKKSSSSLNRKRSGSGSATSVTPSDQKPREEKTAPYRDPRYKKLLETKGSFMDKSKLGVTETTKSIVRTLLETAQDYPRDSLFRDDIFETTCRKVADKNEARVIRDITPLIVPSAENVATYGASQLDGLIESVNEGWNNSIPLTGTRPQPDYSVGFRREAFTEDQLEKLSPFIGDFIAGDQSLFMATYLMHFPFLTSEVKCGAAALDIADRQNAHSGTLAARAIVELFRLVQREEEVNRMILSFSISHDHRSVRIYGHYPEIYGKRTEFYRYPIHTFDFTAMDGKDKWTAYRFTQNVYSIWMPTHFRRICSAIDQLPSYLDFDVPPLPETGLSQELNNNHLSQSDVDSIPVSSDGDQSSAQRRTTPDTSFAGVESVKKARRSRGRRG